MPNISVRLEGDDELLRIAKELKSLKPLKLGLKRGGSFLKGRVAKYPPQRRRPIQFASDTQRRHFFYLMRTKQIEVPYRRGISPGSERHGQSWTIKVERGGLKVVVGSDTSYGPLLQDPDEQTEYHKEGGWKDVGQVAKDAEDDINRIIKQTHDRVIHGGRF